MFTINQIVHQNNFVYALDFYLIIVPNDDSIKQNSEPVANNDVADTTAGFSGAKPAKKIKRKIQHYYKLDDLCNDLDLGDLVPNSGNLNVTLEEVLEKAKVSEGFVDYIMSHKQGSHCQTLYEVKWVGYKDPTWEDEESLTVNALKRYWVQTNNK